MLLLLLVVRLLLLLFLEESGFMGPQSLQHLLLLPTLTGLFFLTPGFSYPPYGRVLGLFFLEGGRKWA